MPNDSSRLQRLAGAVPARFRWLIEPVLVALSGLVSLAVHVHFMLPGLGETDAARFGRIAFLWHLRGKVSFDEVGYQIRTSTLYLQLEKVALDHGVAMHSLPLLVNWVSVLFGTATSVALYVLFRRLTPRPVAIAATLIYTVTPGFWLGNVYGMPTVPGMFFFTVAVIAFLCASQRAAPRGVALVAPLLLAWVCMSLAMTLKSDLALCGGAFLGAAFMRKTQRFRFVVYASAVVVGATAVSVLYARAVVLPSTIVEARGHGLIGFLKSWNESFAVSLDALLTDQNNSVISRCVGGLLFGVIAFSLLRGLVVGGAPRKQALLALLWGLPPILSWGVRFGNSARHNVPAFPPLVLFATIFLFELTQQRVRQAYTLVAVTLFASYFSNTSGDDALRPQSNILALNQFVAKRTRMSHVTALSLARNPALKRVIIGGYADSYTEFEVLAETKHPVIIIGDNWTVTDGDQVTVIDYSTYLEHRPPKQLARDYRAKGYEVLSMSYRL